MYLPIEEESFIGFTQRAKSALTAASTRFTRDLVAEATRLEAGVGGDTQKPEITGKMVRDAETLLRMNQYQARPTIGTRLLRILAAVLPLLVGVLFDKESLSDSLYLTGIGVLFACAILTVTLAVIRD